MFIWMVLLIRKKLLSWHSIVTGYVFFVFVVDMLEVLFNLLLGLYRFPTHLLSDPILDNQLGIIFTDTMILPFSFIIFAYYAAGSSHWKVFITFTLGFVVLEWIYLRFGYLQYINWNHFFTVLRYFVPFGLTMLYDRWELAYQVRGTGSE